MDAGSHDALRTLSRTSTPSVSRKSSTVRIKPKHHASNTSLRAVQTPLPSDRSLTSFPSLSPSLENSPETSRKLADRPRSISGPFEALKPYTKIPHALDGLFDPPAPLTGRSALFSDAPRDIRNIPGTLHHQSDEHIRHIVARTGAVALVRQLAGDLAQRDAQATLVQQKAEEREALLREILRECGLSKLDVDNRLRELERTKKASFDVASASGLSSRRASEASRAYSQPESIHERLSEALGEYLGPEDSNAAGNWASQLDEAHQATIRASMQVSGRSRETQSLTSAVDSSALPPTENKGWKRLFGYGAKATKQPENSSQITDTPKPLSTDLFRPPPPTLARAVSSSASLQEQLHRIKSADPQASDAQSQKSSSSMASWALKLVAGNSQSSGNSGQVSGSRNRAVTLGSSDTAAGQNAISALAGGTTKNRKPTPLNNSNGAMRKPPPETLRNTLSNLIPPISPQTPTSGSDSNLGPVEMDTILPDDTRPPTLLQQHNVNGSSEYLTDRFGFIYDQRRKKRQDEALAAVVETAKGSNSQGIENKRLALDGTQVKDEDTRSIDSRASNSRINSRPDTPLSGEVQEEKKPSKRWQDYLKISNITTTELLSHTPSAAPITSITSGEALPEMIAPPPQVLMVKSGSTTAVSVNPAPSENRTVSGNAEIAQPTNSGTMSPANGAPNIHPDPVRSLLDQLTEVHDALQREKTIRWNEFLRKVRAERKRGGIAAASEGRGKASEMPETTLADGEMIGISGLGNKGKVGRAKWGEFRNLVLGGIPVALRAKVWSECSGASSLRIPGYYDDLVKSEDTDLTTATQIQMDITRTLTDNIYFRKGQGVQKLSEVLLAYARRNPEVGYCQGMNLITACLLLIMPTAEDAFWVLVSMIESILPEKYYDSSLLTSRADQSVLRQYVSELLPHLSNHLEDLGIELEALTFQWFLSIFTDCLQAEALYRVWDVVLCINDGATFLFQVALALLKLNEKQLIACETPAEVYAYINHGVTDHAISIDGLVQASDGLRKVVKREEVEKRRKEAVDRELEETRARQRVKKGKGRVSVEEAVVDGAAALEEPSKSGRGSVRTHRSSREDELDNEYGEQFPAVRTPMEEEVALYPA